MPLPRPFNRHAEPDDDGNVIPLDEPTFDTPDTADVLQLDEPERLAVPVRLVNGVRVDQLPTKLGLTGSFLGAAATTKLDVPRKVLPENQRRASVTFASNVAGPDSYRIGRTEQDVRRDDSSFLVMGNMGPIRFHWTDEVWVMQRSAGTATDMLAMLTEDWAL